MNKIRKAFALTMGSLMIAASCLAFAACGGTEDDSNQPVLGEDGKYYVTVTFDTNLSETSFLDSDVTSVSAQTVEVGSTIVNKPLVIKGSPTNPDNLGFKEWCVDAEGETAWDFADPVELSMTLYAHWESRFVVNYYNGSELVYTDNLFYGEYAEARDSDISMKTVLGWYTDSDFTNEYDFDTPVTSDLDLYAKTQSGVTISASSFVSNASFNFGNSTYKDPDDDSYAELMEDDDGNEYAYLHLARCQNQAYVYFTSVTIWLRDQSDETDRFADVMTITYKNLGSATQIFFYYVACYLQEDGTFTYTNNGGWNTRVTIAIESGMSEDDDWATVSVDLAEETIVDGVSEWGTADVLMVPCWMFVDSNGAGWFENNILISSIDFTPAE